MQIGPKFYTYVCLTIANVKRSELPLSYKREGTVRTQITPRQLSKDFEGISGLVETKMVRVLFPLSEN